MKKITALFIAMSLLVFNIVLIPQASAQTQRIPSETAAREIAANAGGTYVEGAASPALTGTQVALPVADEAGNILGYVVAEKASLVSALDAAGYAEVASAIAATEAGTTAGLAVGAGITAGTVAVGAAATAGVIALVVAATGGDDGGTTTTTHHH
ncbi:MAG: hypothetical protein C4560_08540 [Nitrospiraceae bacterium]|nr:MAG: hypothetical protein C4560_08540 [Nitrospiraceae bacterium]